MSLQSLEYLKPICNVLRETKKTKPTLIVSQRAIEQFEHKPKILFLKITTDGISIMAKPITNDSTKKKENTIWSQTFARMTLHHTSKTPSSPSSSYSPTKYRDRIQK
jgi:hypothetical protein